MGVQPEDCARDLAKAGLLVFNRGIEREALRVAPDGALAASPHPAAFGSKLTHPQITTDFSEAQLELITGVHQSREALLEELDLVHRAVCQALGEERLWPASMPCRLPADAAIPLAQYGVSNLGRLKTCYRSGLGLRYGRAMQTICAVHYNFSPSEALWRALQAREASREARKDYRSRRCFDLMRNFRRHAWLLLYLFGASPAVCNSFLRGRSEALAPFDAQTSYLPHATSLRSGELGYQSHAQAEALNICYNSLTTYVGSLAAAICKPHPPYQALEARAGDGRGGRGGAESQRLQVSANLLQSEAEYYASIRAKQPAGRGGNLLARLLGEGVQYVEVRLLDVSPFAPLGVDAAQLDFLDVFLAHCLLAESQPHDDALCREVDVNMQATVVRGRDPSLALTDQGQARSLREWGAALLDELRPLAAVFDDAADGSVGGSSSRYQEALEQQAARLQDPALTPSGAMLKQMQAGPASFAQLAMAQAEAHRQRFLAMPLSAQEEARFAALRDQSLKDQAQLEKADALPFNDYLAKLMAGYAQLRMAAPQ